MKRTIIALLIFATLVTYSLISFATTETDDGYTTLYGLLSEKAGAPTEYIDDTDLFSEMDSTYFNSKRASNFAIFDLEKNIIYIGGKLAGKNTRMNVWQNLSYDVISEAGYLVLMNYKDINSKSTERFVYAIYDGVNSLFVDTVAECNSGIKKFDSLFGNAQSTGTTTPQASFPQSIPSDYIVLPPEVAETTSIAAPITDPSGMSVAESTVEPTVAPTLAPIVPIRLEAEKQGEYGKLIKMNKESFYVYYVPGGVYSVTNEGAYATQVTVYEGIKKVNGMDEYTASGDVILLRVGETKTINVPDGWFIEIHKPAIITLTLISEN